MTASLARYEDEAYGAVSCRELPEPEIKFEKPSRAKFNTSLRFRREGSGKPSGGSGMHRRRGS